MEYIFLFILYMGSKKCFNAKNFFYITFSHKIQDLGRVSTKKGIVSDGAGGHQRVKKNFFAFLDDSDHA